MEKIIDNINTSDDIYKTIDSFDIVTLEKTILYCNDKYHNSDPVVTDSIYDMMYDFLKLKKPKSKVLKEIGAKVGESVSKNTFVLLVKDKNESTTKINEAVRLGIPIMTPQEFKTTYL